MSIRVVAYGGVEIGTQNVDEGQNVNLKFNGQDISFQVNGFNDQERTRGWSQLNTNNGDVFAFRVDNTVVAFKKPGEDWMGQLPDDRSLADVTMAGSHESTSLYGGFISQCHTVDTAQQLRDGCRFIDIRLKLQDGELKTYHGIQPQNSTLKQQVEWIEGFLRDHPRETVIVSIKQEQESEPEFANKVYEAINSSGMWRFQGEMPKLGDVRGKVCLFTRYGAPYSEGDGFHLNEWPDSLQEGFETDVKGTKWRVHDWYNLPNANSIGEKASSLTRHLEATLQDQGDHPFTLDFASGSKFPDCTPKVVATGSGGGIASVLGAGASLFANITGGGNHGGNDCDPKGEGGVNGRLVRWFLERAAEGKRPRACVMLDFYRDNMQDDANLATLMAALNEI